MKKTIFVLAAMVVGMVAGTAAGCTGVKKPAGTVEKATFGVESSLLPASVWVAENKGYFEEEALKRIGSEEYGLILSDIKLPGLSGIELYDEIGRTAPSLQKRVVFVTGDVISADTEEFLKRMKAPYVTKPFDITKLREEVKRVIAGAG